MAIETRYKAPLAMLFHAPDAGNSPDSGARGYSQIIEDVRAAAEKANPKYGEIARATEFADVNHLTPDQERRLIAAERKLLPRQLAEMSDAAIMLNLRIALDTANIEPGTGIVLYDAEVVSKYSASARRFIFSHELGHRIRETQGESIRSEKEADKVAAEILGPQAAVDALAEIAKIRPLSNDTAFNKQKGGGNYKTDYGRALDIGEEFHDIRIDLSNFPKPTNHYKEPKSKQQKIGPPLMPENRNLLSPYSH